MLFDIVVLFYTGQALCMWQWVTVPFFFTTLEELYTGELVLPIVNGPTEGIICLCLSKLFTAYVGASFWLEPNILFPQYANNVALMFPMAVLSMCSLVINFRIIYKSKHRK
jgi:ethanolaminephosphotransferase